MSLGVTTAAEAVSAPRRAERRPTMNFVQSKSMFFVFMEVKD